MTAGVTPLQVEQAARRWVGTPYIGQASTRAGCDCVGLFVGLGHELGINVTTEKDYPAQPSGARMIQYLVWNCRRLDTIPASLAPIGSVLAYRMRDDDEGPHHLALRTSLGMIHATAPRVVEHALRWADRLHSVWWHPRVQWA